MVCLMHPEDRIPKVNITTNPEMIELRLKFALNDGTLRIHLLKTQCAQWDGEI